MGIPIQIPAMARTTRRPLSLMTIAAISPARLNARSAKDWQRLRLLTGRTVPFRDVEAAWMRPDPHVSFVVAVAAVDLEHNRGPRRQSLVHSGRYRKGLNPSIVGVSRESDGDLRLDTAPFPPSGGSHRDGLDVSLTCLAALALTSKPQMRRWRPIASPDARPLPQCGLRRVKGPSHSAQRLIKIARLAPLCK